MSWITDFARAIRFWTRIFIDIIEINHNHDQAFFNLFLGSDKIYIFKLDTGSHNTKTYPQLIRFIPYVRPETNWVSAYNGSTLRSLGCFELNCIYKGQSQSLTFHVVETTFPPILEMRAYLDIGLIELVYFCILDTTQNNSEPWLQVESCQRFQRYLKVLVFYKGNVLYTQTLPCTRRYTHPVGYPLPFKTN